MAVDILVLVKVHIKLPLELDSTLEADLPIFINSQMAQQGYDEDTMDDKERNYVAALTLESLIPRILGVFSMEVQEVREGPQNTRMPNRTEFMRVLQKAIDNLKQSAGKGSGLIADADATSGAAWPGVGLAKWGSPL